MVKASASQNCSKKLLPSAHDSGSSTIQSHISREGVQAARKEHY
jgi:hypothetical protein